MPQLVDRLFVPESAVPEELVFLRIVQATNAIFLSVAALLTAARQAIGLGDLPHGLLHMDRTLLASRMLQPLAGANALTPKEPWLALRPLIIEPSAIQGQRFPRLTIELRNLAEEVQWILRHPRVPEQRRAFEPLCAELLSESMEAVGRWHAAHGPMSESKNGRGSEGAEWLKGRRGHTLPAKSRNDELPDSASAAAAEPEVAEQPVEVDVDKIEEWSCREISR